MRLAHTSDAERLAELEILIFPENAFNEQTLKGLIQAGRSLVLGDPIVAYALCVESDGLIDLLRLGVHPDHQHQGYGSRFLRELLHVPTNLVLTVRKDNLRAVRLYRHFGLQVVGELENSWVMRAYANIPQEPA